MGSREYEIKITLAILGRTSGKIEERIFWRRGDAYCGAWILALGFFMIFRV